MSTGLDSRTKSDIPKLCENILVISLHALSFLTYKVGILNLLLENTDSGQMMPRCIFALFGFRFNSHKAGFFKKQLA